MPRVYRANQPWTLGHVFVSLYCGEFLACPGYACDRARGTPDWLLIYTLSGAGVFNHAPAEDVVVAGDAVLFKPGTPHHYRIAQSAETWHLCFVHFHAREHWTPWLSWPTKTPGFMRLTIGNAAQRARVVRLLRESEKLAREHHRRQTDLAMNRLEEALLILDESNTSPGATHEHRVDQAIKFIGQNLARPLPVTTIADAVGLSCSRLAHLFSEHMGQTPQEFIESQRFARARLLLENADETIARIARAVGYDDPFYFTRRFRRSTGFSPIAYRRHFRTNAAVKVVDAAAAQ